MLYCDALLRLPRTIRSGKGINVETPICSLEILLFSRRYCCACVHTLILTLVIKCDGGSFVASTATSDRRAIRKELKGYAPEVY